MYCLDKLQREIAYFFSKDIRELPKVESLLAEAGYTQIRKGDEIIKLDSALGLESAIAAPRELDRPPVLSHPRGLQNTDSTSQNKRSGASVAQQVSLEILESQAGKETPSTPTPPTPKGLFDEVDSSVAYTDTKGHTHQIPSDIAQQWLETFGLKDLQETYTPQFSEQVAQALEPILQGEQITLSANSLVKLMQRDRLEFLPYIKDTLEHSDIIIKDKENALIFAKDIGQTSYFTSVSKNDKGEWVISTNSYKTLSQLKNRVSENGEVLYLSKEAPNILAETFTTKAFSNELANDIIPQTKPQIYNTFNQSLKDAHDFFKANNKDAYNDKLFDDVIKVANALDIRFWYQPNAVYMAGSYTYTLNRIMLQSDNFSKENAKTMLHELIHSVTSRAIYAYDNKALREKLSEKQIEAITELKNLYKEVSENNADKVWQKMATFKDELENNKGKLYGLKNEHEMLAELANPSFREFLKEQNIFSKIIEAMAKIFSYVKDKLTGESIKSTNAQSELETILYKIMDNYTNPHAFTNEMSEHFGSRNFVDTARYKEYIKDHKQKFDKDNYKGKHIFSFIDNSMNYYNRSAISGRERFFTSFINNAYFDEKDFDIVQKLKWQMMDPVKRPANFMELKTEKNAHIFEEVEKTHENNIKSLVKEYYGVSYDEFNNAFNGAMKDRHFYEAKDFKYIDYKYYPSTETAFLLALKPYFTSGLYKLLNEADFNVIKDSLYRILQDENLTYRNKPINEWFAKEWVEQDVKALQESFQYKLEQPQGQKGDDLTLFDRDLNINFNAPMKEIKPQLLAALKPIFNQTMTSADGKVKAYMSLKSLSKMTSDKAIQKSVDNGFSREQHLQAVLDIERLFKNSKLQATEPHKSGETNAIIHRLNSELANGNALITTKESLDINKNRIYSVELELIPRFNNSSTPLNTRISEGGFNSQKGHQEQTIKAEPSIAKTDEQSIAQDSNALLESTMKKFNYDGRKAKDLLEWHKDSHL